MGVRSGADHRYTGVWPVVVERRLFVRSWDARSTGWYHAFLRESYGAIQVGNREIPIRARRTRSDRLRAAVTNAYAVKYNTKASRKWVDGFAEPEREEATLELVPVIPSSSGWEP